MRYLLVRVMLALTLGLAMSAAAGTFHDDFEDNNLDGAYWKVMKTDGATKEEVNEVNGHIEYTDFVGGWEGVGIRVGFPLDMTVGQLTIEFDLHQRIQDFHPYLTNFETEGVGGLWKKGILAFNVDSEMIGFEDDGVLGTTAVPEPSFQIPSDKMYHFTYVFTPTGKKTFDFHLLVDDGAIGEAEGELNVGTMDPAAAFLYFEVEQDDWPINEFIYLDNVLITSDAIVGNIGPSPFAVEPANKRTTYWGELKNHR